MKIKNITLHNYKKFVDEKKISFCNSSGDINDLTLIVGNNGSGKSSLLQAIVISLAPLTRDRFKVSSIDWSGFEYRFIQSGRRPLNIQMEIEFSEQELKETVFFAKRLNELGDKLGIPNQQKLVKIKFDYEKMKPIVVGKGGGNYFQFSGYQYAKKLTSFESDKIKLFEKVGNIYWYTEQRTSYNVNEIFEKQNQQINTIRSFLSNAYSFHIAITEGGRELQKGEFDFYEKLSSLYSTVFTDRKFIGSAPRFDLFEKNIVPDFFLSDGHNQYEISEMSAGERAIFPILMDFARYNINNSIIIIDEIELHLHSPLQQSLIRSLLKLGNNNQFIITTHSDTVANMFDESENQIIRLS
ncbi:AAA family ATPase [Flectobacillus roseus]|uniref:AAA family ATPase n=1 Tax=Flectobacillus roseus TaxID=502259 RepID=UPI0024B8321B|nr:AAA family ATPase [Flectobacillus roseus]MDI9871570.1 AAA family ATPase [Flectobacillus roseus]